MGNEREGGKNAKDPIAASDIYQAAAIDRNNTIEELKHLPGGDKFVDNNDKAGNSIVSRITRSLGSLKTLSGAADLLNEGNRNFNLFSHH